MGTGKRTGRKPTAGPPLVYVTRTVAMGTIKDFKLRVYKQMEREGVTLTDLAQHLQITPMAASRLLGAESLDIAVVHAIAQFLNFKEAEYFEE